MNLRQRRLLSKGKTLQRVLSLMLAVLLASLGAFPVFAQTETGQMTVKVTDPHGAVIPGATVTVRSVDRGTMLPAATTGDEGTATVTNLQPALYAVTVTPAGSSDLAQRAPVAVGPRLP